jgi:hypothetical protein
MTVEASHSAPDMPIVPIFDDYSDEEQQEVQFISCSEPVSEQPSPEISQPVSIVHPPVPTRNIQPYVGRGVVEEVACYKFSRICHSFYDPVSKYMEWHFLHILESPCFVSTSTFEEGMNGVTILLSWLHHLLVIIDRVKELPVRKLLEGLWWKFAFT